MKYIFLSFHLYAVYLNRKGTNKEKLKDPTIINYRNPSEERMEVGIKIQSRNQASFGFLLVAMMSARMRQHNK